MINILLWDEFFVNKRKIICSKINTCHSRKKKISKVDFKEIGTQFHLFLLSPKVFLLRHRRCYKRFTKKFTLKIIFN